MVRKRQKPSSSLETSNVDNVEASGDASHEKEGPRIVDDVGRAKRSGFVMATLFVLVIYGSWAVYSYQYDSLPMPLTADQVGKRGFSEEEAMKHVKALTELGPHPVGSDALDRASRYVLAASENIKKTSHWEVTVEVDLFHAQSGANRLFSGHFIGKTLVYSDLRHIILRVLPKYESTAGENAILVSSHIDTVFSGEGAGDCSSCVAVMLELARGISHWAHGFKNAIIFLFNTGEEEGLNGAHSFMTQHPWSDTIRVAIDLESMGTGGKSLLFQAGPHPWAIENFAMSAKYPSGSIIAQDLFSSGAIKSATDFQVYKELGGLSGLDFAYLDNTAVYHTKNDKLKLLKPGSLQHLGENMLAFLVKVAGSSHLSGGKMMETDDTAIYFDILGSYMIVYRQGFANLLHNSVIIQSLLIWITSLLMGGYSAAVSLALSCLSVVLMWICSLVLSSLVAFILPYASSSPVPFVSSTWLVFGLFAAPGLLGAFIGQHVGFLILKRYLSCNLFRRMGKSSAMDRADMAKLDAERWIYKAGSLQWLVLLLVGNYYKIGSSYIALVWLVSPTFAYGLLEATLSPARFPKPLKTLTLLMGLSIPFLVSSGIFIQLGSIIIGSTVRLERNPGGAPEWLGNLVLATYVSTVICLTLVYLLSYVHLSGARRCTILVTSTLFALSLAAVIFGVVPPFTDDTARAVNVVHVVDAKYGMEQGPPSSFISLFSTTPGKLTMEVDQIGEGFICGKAKPLDFVTFSVKYGCLTYNDAETGWTKSDIPALHVERDVRGDFRSTTVSIDTKVSTRWSLAINTKEIEDFELKDDSNELVPLGDKFSSEGWHIIQFSGGKNAPTKFNLTLFWTKNQTRNDEKKEDLLLKLRTDLDRLTPQTKRVLKKLPSWCSLFGKSTSPFTLAFLTSLPVTF